MNELHEHPRRDQGFRPRFHHGLGLILALKRQHETTAFSPRRSTSSFNPRPVSASALIGCYTQLWLLHAASAEAFPAALGM